MKSKNCVTFVWPATGASLVFPLVFGWSTSIESTFFERKAKKKR